MSNSAYKLIVDKWMSEQLNKDSFYLVRDNSGEPISKALAKIPSKSFVSAKLGTHDTRSVIDLCSNGFFLADTAITFEIPQSQELRQLAKEITHASPEDREEVVEIARSSFVYSRFHRDPYIREDLADQIKANWAENYFNGKRGTHMLLATDKSKILGFNQIIETEDTLLIDLIAVLPNYQQCGIGSSLIGGIGNIGINKKVRVGTQICNTTSVNFYQKIGFKIVDLRYVFHRHGLMSTSHD